MKPSRDWLAHEYIALERGCPDIARELGCDPSTVRLRLIECGIPTRKRGHTRESVENRRKGQGALRGRGHTPEAIAKIRASTLADGRVPYLRDGRHWLAGAAPEKNPNWKGGITPERQAFNRTTEWKVAVRAVWDRANACCERCSLDYRAVRSEQTFHVHHIVGFAVVALRAVVSNLRLLCVDCHRFVHSRANTTRELLEAEERKQGMPTLFDALEAETKEAA